MIKISPSVTLSLHLVFGLNDPQVVSVSAEGVQDVLLVLHP